MAARSLVQTLAGREYRSSYLRPDLLAGLTVAAMLVPQAMAYAELGGLPPSAGFRAALMALPVYVLLGTSRHLGIGPEPGTAVLAATAVAPMAAGDPDRYLALMAMMAILVGGVALVAGVLRLGVVADLLSTPVLVGYITGVGLTLLTSQLQPLTGVPVESDEVLPRLVDFVDRIDEIDGPTTAVGLSTLAVILGLRRWKPALPGALIALLGSMAVVALGDLDVATIGAIEGAFPSLAWPDVGVDDMRDLLPAAAGVALIGYSDNILTARSISSKQDYEVDADRELLALGAMNAAAGMGGGFPVSSSASRSFVPASLGSHTQLVSVVAFVSVAILLAVGTDLLADIPRAGLAAVIVAAAFAVIDVEGFRRLWRVSRVEAGLAAVTCVAVITTDLLYGVLLAVALSMLVTLARVARPHDAVLGAGAGLDGWIDVDDERAEILEGLLVYRFDAPLFFANAEWFGERLRLALERNPGDERTVVLDFEGVGSVDSTAAEHLSRLCEDLADEGIEVSVARANSRVLDLLDRSGFLDEIGRERVYPTINAAVRAHRWKG